MLCSVTPRLEVLFDHGLLVNSTLFSICLHLFLTSLLVGRDTSLGILDGLALPCHEGVHESIFDLLVGTNNSLTDFAGFHGAVLIQNGTGNLVGHTGKTINNAVLDFLVTADNAVLYLLVTLGDSLSDLVHVVCKLSHNYYLL